jgi:hypothetical protein
MDTDMKWVLIISAVFIGIPCAGMALSDYQHSQCRLAGIQAQMPADDILKLCGK